ncbi:hypothetical protein COU01_03355 [Candidatus Falkowbacteria bacterium CG10_big_fil_rev_8_21_14_0_10_44_15]|uniref:Uncharacterized protein n=1 Tax=Candidatus Falkowbacteria bacterium CG10_big_fil_rev_8_21_14_0_10_44_15 TaxID=1974569 RepID=A0A2H0UZ72_9BACT|nr:MAG: hypothetical protein COU01_03355 [Candidatus Falkowbacteria bacterium CG10_big_fil_rev_8_21_14_0_10_44_15]
MSLVLKIRFVLYSTLSLIVLFLIYQAVAPAGKIIYSVTPCDSSFFIQQLKPKERVGEIERANCTQRIIGEPVYFNVNTQRTFNEARVTFVYRDSGQNNIIEVGLQADERKNYSLKPLENKIIDRLSRSTAGWGTLEQDGVILLQREPKFKNIDEFLNNLPARNEILAYHYDLPQIKYIEDYQTSTGLLLPDRIGNRNDTPPLRGAYQFYTYIKNEPLNFKFNFSDLNINKDKDDVKIIVYYQNEPIAEKYLADERSGEEQRQRMAAGAVSLNLNDLPEGFYKIAVMADDDIITDNVNTAQTVVSFINRVWLGGQNDKNKTIIYADAPEVTASTLNAASLQTILVNKQELPLAETYRQFSLPTRQNKTIVQLEISDVIISGAGVFSFGQSSLYNPDYKKMTKISDVDAEKVNYLITTYSPCGESDMSTCRPQGEWKTKTISFDLTKSFRYQNNYSFIISVPGLIAGDEADDYVEIKSINIKLTGKSLWDKIKEIL